LTTEALMEGKSDISIVTPSLNQAQYLPKTLESVLSQNYAPLEYVVIDGGSRDESAEIIRGYQEQLAYWVSEPDAGHADALNKGFARTSGDVMAWINSSDVYYPWTFETVSEIFTQLPGVEWIMGMPTQFASVGGPRSVQRGYFNVYDVLAGRYRWIQQESVFWRRSLWNRAGGHLDESLGFAADFELWLRFFRLAPLYHVETVLGGWRSHDDSLGSQGTGGYMSEVKTLAARFVADASHCSRTRARWVRALDYRQGHSANVGRLLHRLGMWSWYAHPRIHFDFERELWVAE
jgi:hypothetical protein